MTLLGASLLGGVLALDGTALGQFMLSRPMAAGLLAGWLAGDAMAGMLVGVVLEIYLLVAFPVGGARFPEGATATVVAAVTAATHPSAGALALGVGLGLVWGQVGGWTISGLRTVNAFLAPDPAHRPIRPARVVAGHLIALVLDFVRGAVVTGAGVWFADLAVRRLGGSWPLGPDDTRGLLLVGATVSTGILLRSFGGLDRRAFLFLGGLAAGVVGGLLL
jgi:mannose/fructose/N-acetylgalactosamine-specific phosphotransferase system component IIC